MIHSGVFGLRFANGIDADALRPYAGCRVFQLREKIWWVDGIVFVDDHDGFGVVSSHRHRPPAEDRDFGNGAVG